MSDIVTSMVFRTGFWPNAISVEFLFITSLFHQYARIKGFSFLPQWFKASLKRSFSKDFPPTTQHQCHWMITTNSDSTNNTLTLKAELQFESVVANQRVYPTRPIWPKINRCLKNFENFTAPPSGMEGQNCFCSGKRPYVMWEINITETIQLPQ